MTEATASTQPHRSATAPTRRRWVFGPGFLVTAAFIGPGTVTTALTAGYRHGLDLLWVVALSTIAAIVLQEMAGRLGLVLGKPLGEILREQVQPRELRYVLLGLVLLAILFGNAAYQGGNLLGAVNGLNLLTGDQILANNTVAIAALIVALLTAGSLLAIGNPSLVRWVLVAMVIGLSGLFLWIAWTVLPASDQWTAGLQPRLPSGASATTLGLFGTTIVPYNLFLYTSLLATVSRREAIEQADTTDNQQRRWLLFASRMDIVLAVGLGGLVTAAIVIAGAAAGQGNATATVDFTRLPSELATLLPESVTRIVLGLGLLAAGLTSAITAPLAAAYCAAGIFAWPQELRDRRFQSVWVGVLLVGGIACGASILYQVKPTQAILLAQAANGLFLPAIAILLWWLVSKRSLLGDFANGPLMQVFSLIVVSGLSIAWLVSVGGKLWTQWTAGS